MSKPSASAKALRDSLSAYKAEKLTSHSAKNDGKIIEIDSTLSPMEAASTLWEYSILGAPVWDAAKGEYIGFFDMRDILSAVTASARKYVKRGDDDGSGSVDEYQAVMGQELGSMSVGGGIVTLSYLAARNPFVPCSPDTSLADVCRILVTKRCHRVVISPAAEVGSRCTSIVSQSALVKFLSSHVESKHLKQTLDEAGLNYRKEVVSIVDTATAYDAFDMLDSHRLSGIAVVDEDGELVGNTSARDIKLAAQNRADIAMDMDILSYLAALRQSIPEKNERYPNCHVHDDATVAHVVNLLAKTGYHRVFVVGKDQKPVGVISVSDVISFATAE